MNQPSPMFTTFLLLAMALVSPHLDWPTARYAALVCILLAIIFFFIDLWIAK